MLGLPIKQNFLMHFSLSKYFSFIINSQNKYMIKRSILFVNNSKSKIKMKFNLTFYF